MKYTLGFSPCPNDTFIFDALVNHKIDTKGIEFDVILEDVETLNRWAIEKKLDFSKISYGVLPAVSPYYWLLQSGGALGKGVGPLLISLPGNNAIQMYPETATVAIPGENTTAHLLFSLAYPTISNKKMMVFHEIETAVLTGKVDAGVIIHENRFTYQKKGLIKLKDLGEYWESATGSPIPLGGIIAKRTLPTALLLQIDALIQESVAYAYQKHHQTLADFVQQHAQEMQPTIMRQHIDLYVNDYSFTLGENGKKAVATLLKIYADMHHNAMPLLQDVCIA
ncbi:MAG: 1,4-dihydroxy-6-naphthoate synthase [Hydrotalea flava]|uniref:1,4-dihydroxy-6-naphthoate synthase n=1 Tax=Hydrotalea lipotrueae TaxID=2803817 RepID=UPI001C47A81E|nr:1,4-dihydroxy-6-naphthoate synthase [Hydrotalea lipotrueae]MBY0348142.1 1,4-dihydroxy-6-naphthoate synthase [Hydrotalea flava]